MHDLIRETEENRVLRFEPFLHVEQRALSCFRIHAIDIVGGRLPLSCSCFISCRGCGVLREIAFEETAEMTQQRHLAFKFRREVIDGKRMERVLLVLGGNPLIVFDDRATGVADHFTRVIEMHTNRSVA